MALLVRHLLEHIRDTLGGGELPPGLSATSIVNEAGEHLYSMHPWRWAQGRSALLSLRGTITGTAATWTQSSKTITLTNSFTNYTLVSGDELEVTGGTGLTTGFVKVLTNPTVSTVTIDTDVGADAVDMTFTLQPYSIDLPDDTRDVIAIHGTDSVQRHITLTSLAEVLRARENTGPQNIHWFAAVSYAGSPPTPILEIGPGAGSSETGAFRMFYRSRWADVLADNAVVDIPAFVVSLLKQIVRAFARGYAREDNGSLDERLSVIQGGPIFYAAIKSDGNIQPYYGKTRGGGPSIWRRGNRGDFHETLSRIDGPL